MMTMICICKHLTGEVSYFILETMMFLYVYLASAISYLLKYKCSILKSIIRFILEYYIRFLTYYIKTVYHI